MINYNPKDWFGFVIRFHKADTMSKLGPFLLVITIYTTGIAIAQMEWLHWTDKSFLKNLPVMHTLLGFAISMLLVFRTNTAYDRWWEGRKLWGNLVNSSRNLAIKLSAILPANDHELRAFVRKTIPAYAYALHHHLRRDTTRIELFDEEHHAIIDQIDTKKHTPNQLAALLYHQLNQACIDKKMNDFQWQVLNKELMEFTEVCGACERIKNTPIPFSYSIFLKKFIFIYILTLPIGLVFTLGYFVIPVVFIVFYVLASLEVIAEEIEDPFGGDANDLPTEKMAANIHKHVRELI
jgi:putative membrane protein